MDPEATYADFLAALNAGDAEVASHRLDDLATWIARGGFVPSKLLVRTLRPHELARLLTSAAVVLAWAANDLNHEGETT
ncbi:MAG: hypothetical protein L0Z62_12535 [Gemmataceae bacterium]|nr:hypothetical protein [Gemmataceae bacterium]